VNPYLIVALAPLMWAGNFVVGRAITGQMTPVELAHWRWAVALACLLPLGLPRLRAEWPLIRANLGRLTLLGAIGVGGFNTLVYTGLQTTEASNALLIIAVMPMVILLLGRWIYAVPVGRRQMLGVGVSLLGMLAIISGGDWRTIVELSFKRGDLWLLAAVLCWSLYSVWLRWKPAQLSALGFLSYTVLVGYALLALLYWPQVLAGKDLPGGASSWAAIAYTGLCASLIAFLCWNHGVKHLGAGVAGQFIHLQLVFGTALAMIFLGEQLTAADVLGAVLIGAGILLTIWPRRG